MASPSSGALTFLFTDIERSTQLWEQHPDAMHAALARHDSLLRDAVQTHGGRVVKSTGDGVHAAFGDPLESVNAALAAQHALAAEGWREVGVVRVRMALHSGPAEQRAGDYFGPVLNRAARLMAVGHGGQVLLSDATAALVREDLPPGITLRDLGEHRLKDLTRPERVYQVVAPDLPVDFLPLNSLGALPNNLPVQLTRLVGRERELAEVRQLLPGTHLLTLTGPGGTGKTRLSLQLAADVLEQFPDGVWLIELAPLADPALVPQTVAATVGLYEHLNRTPLDALLDFLRAKTSLLVLDNCEHLIHACAQLAAALLRNAPRLKILASSREPLGIDGEVSYRVPPLSLPAGPDVAQSEAVQLFVERATAAQPHFRLSEHNAPAVAQICRRLDGIPLAIELAAARVKVFSPEQIAARLDDRFRLLTGGSRTALERHQTLRALIDWSYDLLSEPERVLLRRLSVFAGGWAYEGAEAVCAEADVLDPLTHLVDKSLVLAEEHDGAVRYRFLETIRQYARDKLLESGESESIRDRHLDYVVEVTSHAPQQLYGFESRELTDRFDQELDNIRAALEWALARRPELALRIVGSIGAIWSSRGYVIEGRRWCEQALAQTQSMTQTEVLPLRAKAYLALASAAATQGDVEAARQASDESVKLYRALGRPPEMVEALGMRVTTAMFLGEVENGRALADETLALARAVGDRLGESMAMIMLARLSASQGKFEALAEYAEQAVLVAREAGSPAALAMALMVSGMAIAQARDYARARARLEESYALFRELHNDHFVTATRSELANVARLGGDFEHAVPLYRETIRYWQHIGQRAGIARCLECLAFIAGAHAAFESAARLFGAAESLREAAHARMTPEEQVEYAQQLQQIRARADEAPFNAAWARGRALTLEQAIALALDAETSPPPAAMPRDG